MLRNNISVIFKKKSLAFFHRFAKRKTFNKIQKASIAKVTSMNSANYWRDALDNPNTFLMGQTLSEPITHKMTTCIQNMLYHVGSSAMQGWRITMEDTHVQILSLPEDQGTAYFGVFDGHGGAGVAKYAGRHLHRCLLRRPEYHTDTEEALKQAFLDCDSQLHYNMAAEEVGSTAIVVLIKENRLYCANIGDSRAVACVNGRCEPLSEDHKPENTRELRRINEAGGWVHANRVNGNLALSRALGDFVFKRNSKKRPDQQIVIAYPDVITHPINESWEFVLLACDGIWDVMPSESVIRFCRERIGQGMPIEKICEELLNCCLSPNVPLDGFGGDNMTVVLVCFLHNKGYDNLVKRCAAKGEKLVGDAAFNEKPKYNRMADTSSDDSLTMGREYTNNSRL